jgi:phage shock protein PspC (stress-responsive transcriptional regulator)
MITGMEPETPEQSPPPDESPSEPAGDQPDTEPADGGGTGWSPPFQILRSRQERKLGGVAGGLAAAANLDPTLVRMAVILGCLTGWGILAYLIAWAVIPEENPDKGRYLMPAPEPTAKYLRIGLMIAGGLGVLQVLGAVLGIVSSAILGIGLLPLHVLGIGHDSGLEGGEALLGLLLLIGGLLLVFRRHLPWMPTFDGGPGSGAAPGTGASWAPPAPSPSGMALATWRPGAAGAGAGAGAAGGAYGPPAPPASGASDFGSAFGARASAAARIARANGPLLLVRAFGWLVALWFLAGLLVGGAFWISGAVNVRLPALPIVTSIAALSVLGYTLVRSRRIGAVIGAMALLIVPMGLAGALSRVDGQAGDRSVTPIAMSDLEPKYQHSAGVFELDLSRLELPTASPTEIDIDMGVGKIDVVVPWDADVDSRAAVGAGTFFLFGNRQTGVNLNGRTHSIGRPGAPVLVISGEAGIGEIVVRRAREPFTHEALRTGQAVPVRCSFYPAGPDQAAAAAGTGTVTCGPADGVTRTPPLNCVVASSGFGLCRPAGEAEPAVDYADVAGTRRCQVPAGGGSSTCTPPVSGTTARSGGSFTCTIPEGGGPAVCKPSTSAGAVDPNAPAPPVTPTSPADPNSPPEPTEPGEPTGPTAPPATAAPGEYRCTVPEGGGPATCEPA